VPDHLVVEDGRRRIEVHAEGTSDTVIWNPGPWAGAKIGDLDRDDWRAFLCVEAAVASAPVSLLPGGARSLSQTLRLT
jgi:glucose-6-phosphate 1-epimerase